MREALKKSSITKQASIHTLRHSYATHLLEQGINIVTIKNLLGHAKIETTMVYLHIAQCPLVQAHSPLDTLYPKSQWQKSAVLYPNNIQKSNRELILNLEFIK
jgi:site-specific recombinase XerD